MRKRKSYSERATAVVQSASNKLKDMQTLYSNFTVAAMVAAMPELTLAVVAARTHGGKPLPSLLQLSLPEAMRPHIEVTENLISTGAAGKVGETRVAASAAAAKTQHVEPLESLYGMGRAFENVLASLRTAGVTVVAARDNPTASLLVAGAFSDLNRVMEWTVMGVPDGPPPNVRTAAEEDAETPP